MKNVEKNSLRTCITMGIEEFEEMLTAAYGREIDVDTEWDGLIIRDKQAEDGEGEISDKHLTDTLSKYFDTNVTSIHVDDCDYPLVWIVYKDNCA